MKKQRSFGIKTDDTLFKSRSPGYGGTIMGGGGVLKLPETCEKAQCRLKFDHDSFLPRRTDLR